MIKRVFRQMTTTQILSAMTVTVCLLFDSFFIGRLLGVKAMSAYGLATPVIILMNAFGSTVACGVQVLIGKVMGKGDTDGCRSCFTTSVVLSLILSALWIIVIFAAALPLCNLLGAGGSSADGQVLGMTGDYLRGYILGAPFYFFSQIMVPYLQTMGRRKLTLISVAVMTVTDIACDLLSIYVFDAGMFGVGLASGISYLTASLVGLIYFLRKDCPFKFSAKTFSLRASGSIAHGGSPIVVNQAFFMIRVYVLNQILLAISGTIAVAALSVMSTVGNIIYSIGMGSGSIALMLSSIFYNEEDRNSLYDLIRIMIPHSLKLIVTTTVAAALAAPWLIRLFLGSDPEVLRIAVPGFRFYAISLIAAVLTTVLKNYYQGTDRMPLTNVISFFDNVGLMLTITWLFSKLMGLTGVWAGILVAQIGTLLFISAVIWVRNHKVSLSAEAYALLKPDFGSDPSNVMLLSVTDKDSAIKASQQLREFCLEKGLGDKVSLLVGLCVEELAMNTIEFGFSEDDRAHSVEVRLVTDGKQGILRLRDDCINFDPTHYMDLYQDDDPSAHIGLKLVMGLVKDVNYTNSLGLNNLYMRIHAA